MHGRKTKGRLLEGIKADETMGVLIFNISLYPHSSRKKRLKVFFPAFSCAFLGRSRWSIA